MKKIEFKSGTVEIYETKEEMIGILSEQLGKDEVDWTLRDSRFKDSFNPNTKESHYIKKVIAIKVPSEEHKTLMCFEHWNYERDWNSDGRKKVLNMNTYSSGFACTTFRRSNKDKQNCFIEYYNTVRDDDRIEKILNTFKVGDKIYFGTDKNTLSVETINYIGFDCEEMFVVEVGTNEKEKKFAIVRVNEGSYCSTFSCEKSLYPSLETAREVCLKALRETKDDYKKRLSSVEKRIFETMSFVG